MNDTINNNELSIEDVLNLLSDNKIEINDEILSSLPNGLTDQMLLAILSRYVPTCKAIAITV